ncbi:MAG: hypothetical protein ACYDCL_00730 [Myxococcales bacterium]
MRLRFASLAVVFALAFGAMAAALTLAGRRTKADPPEGRGLVRATIKTVATGGGAPPVGVIVLAPAGSSLVVPLFVTAGEAGIVGERRSAAAGPGLPGSALAALGATLTAVVLDGAETPTARAQLAVGRRQRNAVASVADAIEWAESVGAPIWLSPRLLQARGIEERQLEKLAPGLDPKHAEPEEHEGPAAPESQTF